MKIRVLQLGGTSQFSNVPCNLEMDWQLNPTIQVSDEEYDLAIIGRVLTDEEANAIIKIVRAHCLFVLDDVKMTSPMEQMVQSRFGKVMSETELLRFLNQNIDYYFTVPYGEKFNIQACAISPSFHGAVKYNGNSEIVLDGTFGQSFTQIAYWRNNIPVEKNQAIDFWLEYEKSEDVQIELHIDQFVSGSVSTIQNRWVFDETQLQNQITIKSSQFDGPVFVSIYAKGNGTLKIIALHDRYSRGGLGTFLPGAKRYVTQLREEIFAFFDKGDLKPPLSVYFSGYKTMEGFEGYRMMRRMGCPFLLISDARLEGGSFYLGDQEYENTLANIIRDALTELGFTCEDLVLSGLSMGTFGALYYGTMLHPAYTIVGKPLLNLGTMAKKERIERPHVFPTSLDVVYKQYNSLNEEKIKELDMKFWQHFDQADLSNSTYYIAYMIEDDYDESAYQDLLGHVKDRGAKIIGKGIHGRHNDDTSGIVSWFIRQYKRVFTQGYDRKVD